MDAAVLKQTNGLQKRGKDRTGARLLRFQNRLLLFSLFNFFVVACLGLLLRSFPFLSSFPFAYQNLLHGHSHFAFGGWVMPVLILLILIYFPEVQKGVSFRHWRNIVVLTLVAAYGMLASFPVQGYKAVSISFSTLSIAAGFYLAIVVWKALPKNNATAAHLFLKAALFYLALSALGPFATGPLIAIGKSGTPLYFDVIYFYLHFQYNGWFVLTLLAVFYKIMEEHKPVNNSKKVFFLFSLSCLPAYFLSVLWHQPGQIFNIVGGSAALAQVAGLYFLSKDVKDFHWARNGSALLFKLAFAAFALKNVFQLVGAFPAVASLTYSFRNFIIAYLHLVLLGFVSLFCLAALIHARKIVLNKGVKSGLILFLFSFITTEALLTLNASEGMLSFTVPHLALLLFYCSLCFPLGIGLLAAQALKRKEVPKTEIPYLPDMEFL